MPPHEQSLDYAIIMSAMDSTLLLEMASVHLNKAGRPVVGAAGRPNTLGNASGKKPLSASPFILVGISQEPGFALPQRRSAR